MVKLLGVLLLMSGSVGFSAAICREQKKKRLQLLEMKHMFMLIQEHIQYSGLPIPLIIQKTVTKVREPFAGALMSISDILYQNDGEQLKIVWEREMCKITAELSLSLEQRELLYEFPKTLGHWEKEGQARAISVYIEEIQKWITQLEKEEKDQNKVIMSLGAAAGILLSVLLL